MEVETSRRTAFTISCVAHFSYNARWNRLTGILIFVYTCQSRSNPAFFNAVHTIQLYFSPTKLKTHFHISTLSHFHITSRLLPLIDNLPPFVFSTIPFAKSFPPLTTRQLFLSSHHEQSNQSINQPTNKPLTISHKL
jgi:hypothetical protein